MRRLRNLLLGISAFGLLAAGAGVAIARFARAPSAGCHGYLGCATVPAGRAPAVVIDSQSALGLHKPTAIAMCHSHLWVADAGGNSVTEFTWRAGGKPVVWSGRRYRFKRPGAITVGRDVIWVANSDSITEMKTTDGKVVQVVSGPAWVDKPRALVLFGRKLWVANAASVTEINAASSDRQPWLLGPARSGSPTPGTVRWPNSIPPQAGSSACSPAPDMASPA